MSPTSYNATGNHSAAAKDSTGNTVTGSGFGRTRLNFTIAAVSATGLAMAKAIGTAGMVASVACCGSDTAAVKIVQAPRQVIVSPPAGGVADTSGQPLWQDGFESGDLSTTQNGAHWTASSRAVVSGDMARTGSYSLRFRYPGKADLTKDAWAEQRFNLGSLHSEVWIDYWLYVPSNYVHRNSGGANNNKFFFMWDSRKYPGGGRGAASFMFSLEHRKDNRSLLIMMWSSESELMRTHKAPEINPFITDADKGRWNHVQIHARTASAPGAPDGTVQLWWNGALGISWHGPLYDSGINGFQKGYLMGWANSGYTDTTVFYIDDFKVYDQSPGW